jgi:hypothetical protein
MQAACSEAPVPPRPREMQGNTKELLPSLWHPGVEWAWQAGRGNLSVAARAWAARMVTATLVQHTGACGMDLLLLEAL